MRKMFIRTVVAVDLAVAAALAIAVVAAIAAQEHRPLSDPQIKGQLEHRLLEQRIEGVTVTVRERIVTLTGTVTSGWARDEAIEQAKKIDQVANVINALTIPIPRPESEDAPQRSSGRRR